MREDTVVENMFSDQVTDQKFDLDQFDASLEYGDQFIQTNGFLLRFDVDDEY